MHRACALLAICSVLAVSAQQPMAPSAPPRTTVNADGTITFRLKAPGAGGVVVQTDAAPAPLPMQKDENGVWSAVTAPLKPEHYGYSFRVDGVEQRDPLNPAIRPNLVGLSSDILVPGSVPQAWELQAVPHGSVTRHMFTTHTAQGLPANQEPYLVYTPPGYDAKHAGGYPMLVLAHGWSDNEFGWTDVGQANLIFDTLIAQNKTIPMLVVMPLGYGDYSYVIRGPGVPNDSARVERNASIYADMLLGEILPAVARDYAVAAEPEKHAIAGLSMGGLEAITIGLKHPEIFRYVVGMSSGFHDVQFDQQFPNFAAGNGNNFAHYKLLWVACGTGDALLTPNRQFVAWARQRNLPVTAIETAGQHTWLVWRDNLLTVAPLLFK